MKTNKQIDTEIHDLNLRGNYLEAFKSWQEKGNYKQINENKEFGLKKGDIIEFWGGYNNDIRFKSTIHGFDENGKAYINWDCYWFPVDFTETGQRDFKKIVQE